MKAAFALLALGIAFAGASAHADDGGVVGIAVKDLTVSKVTYGNNGPVYSPIAQPSYEIKLNGGEAAKLMKALPSQLSVITGQYPNFAPIFNANFKALEITAGKKQPTVTIACEGGDQKFSDSGTPSFVPYKDGAHCTISINPVYSDDDNIQYTFNPDRNGCRH